MTVHKAAPYLPGVFRRAYQHANKLALVRPTARGAKAAVARDVASIQTAALNAMIRHRLDPESLGIVGRSMANRLA